MRRFAWCAVLVVLVASCGSGSEPSTTENATPAVTTISTIAETTTTRPEPTTTTTASGRWTVAELGRNPTRSLGPTTALGSGCSPGSDALPDGVWFGWLGALDDDAIAFDLACLWPGRLEPAASNDAPRVRMVDVDDDALVYLTDQPVAYTAWAAEGDGATTAAANAPGLPDTLPFWVFVNDGAVTEIAQHDRPIPWAKTAGAWPGLFPGCCDGGTVAPPSPEGAWPATGWPADGFYGAWVSDHTDTRLDLALSQWFSCRDHPGACPEWWTGDEVSSDPDAPQLERSVPFDGNLTVVILPLLDDTPIVGDGVALHALLEDVESLRDEWEASWGTFSADEWRERSSDPSFPFGLADPSSAYVLDLAAYRGPGQTYLMMPNFDQSLIGSCWWPAVEIRDGQPILYLHAGLFAG